jgi:hypothetical protein
MKNPKIIITVMAALFLIFVFGCNKDDDTQTDSNPVEVDYTKLELGIKGEGLVYFGQTSSWDKILSSRIPMEAGSDLLEYNFGLFYLSEGCNFLISDNEATSDFYSIGYSNVSITGDDADSLHSAPNNGFTVANAGEYYLKFFINTSNHKLYLKVEKRIEIILDGTYIMGSGTALESFDNKSRMTIARNEVTQEDRSELVEKYIAVKAGSEGFNIYVVDYGVTTKLGPGSDFAVVTELDHEEPTLGLWRGQIAETETPFTVSEDGLYHVAYDSEIGIVTMARVIWGIIGGATPGGWAESTEMEASAFDLNTISFSIPSLTLLENDYKFRYSNGWKVILDADFDLGDGNRGIIVNANYGGEVGNLIAGGYSLINDNYANYSVSMTWSIEDGHKASVEFESEADPPSEYPEELYMIGASIGGWDWTTNGIQMIPVHSNPHLFWKIVWIEQGVDDAGIKFAPGMEWVGDFGVDAAAGATDGVWTMGEDLVPDDHNTGYYMVVVNLQEETIEINAPMVYGLGDAFGSWDVGTLFTVDNTNEVVESPAFIADAELRIYIAANTLTIADGSPIEWWQAEFIALDGVIEYRGTGNDQEKLNVSAGQMIKLNFRTETAIVE